ncbi:MAG: hypothetical protein QW230_01945 [Thermofilum sp.]
MQASFRVELPLSPSLSATWIYEGLLALRAQVLGSMLQDERCEELKQLFVGNDIKVLSKFLGKGSLKELSVRDLLQGLQPAPGEELVLQSRVYASRGLHAVGSAAWLLDPDRVKREGVSLQVLKVERYQTLSSMELGTLSKQVTTYFDRYALFLFLLGLASTYVSRVQNDLLFIPFDVPTLAEVVWSGKPGAEQLWLSVREKARSRVRSSLSSLKAWSEEYVWLRVAFNREFIESAKSLEREVFGFRIVRLRREGNALKIYEDLPMQFLLSSKLYANPYLLDRIQDALDVLERPLGAFLRGKGSAAGQRAFRALKYLYAYSETHNQYLLASYFRELHELCEELGGGQCRKAFL